MGRGRSLRPLGEVEPDRLVGLKCGIFDRRHHDRMGPALWLFSWAIRRQNRRDGWVLDGRFLSIQDIADESGIPRRTVQRYLAKLRDVYLEVQGVRGKGIRLRVKNPKKWSAPVIPEEDQRGYPKPSATSGITDQASPDLALEQAPHPPDLAPHPPDLVPDLALANNYRKREEEREKRERTRAREGGEKMKKGNGAERPPLALAIDRLRDAMEKQGLAYWLEEKLPLLLSNIETRALFEPAMLAATDCQLTTFARYARTRVDELKKIHRSYHGRFAVEDLRREVFDAPPTEDDKWAAEAAKRRKKR